MLETRQETSTRLKLLFQRLDDWLHMKEMASETGSKVCEREKESVIAHR